MLAAVAGLWLIATSRQEADPSRDPAEQPVEVVRLGSRDALLTWPDGGAPAPSRYVTWRDWRFEVRPDGTLGRRFRKDGGWVDARELYEASKATTNRFALPILVVMQTKCSILERTRTGLYRQRRGTLTLSQQDDVVQAVSRFKALVEASTGGQVEARVQLRVDDDLEIVRLEPGRTPASGTVTLKTPTEPDLFGPGHTALAVAPFLNSTPFDSEDGQFWGPYAAAIVIHPAPTRVAALQRVGETPVAYIGYHTFTDGNPAEELAPRMLAVLPRVLGSVVLTDEPQSGRGAWPRFIGGPGLAILAAKSVGAKVPPVDGEVVSASTLAALPTLPGQDAPKSQLAPTTVDGRRGFLVDPAYADLAVDRLREQASTELAGWVPTPSGLKLAVVSGAAPRETVAETLGLTVEGEPTQPAVPQASGAYTATAIDDPQAGPAVEVELRGPVNRGRVLLVTGSPLIPEGQDTAVEFGARINRDESVALNFLDQSGDIVESVLISGEAVSPAEETRTVPVRDGRVPATNAWQRVRHRLTPYAPITAIEIGPPPFGQAQERLSSGPVTLAVTTPQLTPAADQEALPEYAPPGPVELPPVAEDGTVSSSDWPAWQAALTSRDASLLLNALVRFTTVREPQAVPYLVEVASSVQAIPAMLAIEALRHQGSLEATEALRQLVERAPFEHSKRFAASTFIQNPEPPMAAALNMLAVQGWRSRLEGAKALGAIDSEPGRIILAAMLLNEPHPAVRREITRLADASFPLAAQRILYAAVNDPSEWVRATAYARAIDSPLPEIRTDALRGVTDPSPAVRLYLLEMMTANPKDEYRPALRLAVVDRDPAVRAAALEAFAVQPGPVVVEEVQNTLKDNHPRVRAALAKLAQAKGLVLP